MATRAEIYYAALLQINDNVNAVHNLAILDEEVPMSEDDHSQLENVSEQLYQSIVQISELARHLGSGFDDPDIDGYVSPTKLED